MAKKPAAASTTTARKKIYLQSLGCPKNLVDSEIMLGTLASQGYELTTDRGAAEVIIVNTCGFLQASAKESIDTILDLSREKESGNCQKLVVTGCLSQRYAGELPKEFPEVDLFIGTNDYARIAEAIELKDSPESSVRRPESLTLDSRLWAQDFPYLPSSDMPRLLATAQHTAYVKIAEGCNHTCSFCIIPRLRGKQRSRPVEDIVAEVKNLLAMGVKELNLIAQDTTDYGGDLHDGTTIEKLFRALAEIPGAHWVRLMYAYPLRFSDQLIEIMASSPNFCRYADIPFQHINDRILGSMHRGSNGIYIRRLVERLRKRIPEIAIRSTFIVGYPGETEPEFEQLLEFLEEAKLERVGAFPYSPEPGTEAATLQDQLPDETKKQRLDRLMTRQQKISLQKNRERIGRKVRVLVEGSDWGRTEWDAPEIDGKILLSGKATRGDLVEAMVEDASEYDLTGRIC